MSTFYFRTNHKHNILKIMLDYARNILTLDVTKREIGVAPMPEFILDGKHETVFTALPEIAQGFIEAMFFTSNSCEDSEDWFSEETQHGLQEGTIDGCLPANVGFNELHQDAIAKILKFCADFEERAGNLLDAIRDGEIDGYDMERVGNDLWYTSQGHGVGFWSRDELELVGDKQEEYERLTNVMIDNRDNNEIWDKACSERSKLKKESLGEKLSALCRYNEMNPSYGEDGFVYLD